MHFHSSLVCAHIFFIACMYVFDDMYVNVETWSAKAGPNMPAPVTVRVPAPDSDVICIFTRMDFASGATWMAKNPCSLSHTPPPQSVTGPGITLSVRSHEAYVAQVPAVHGRMHKPARKTHDSIDPRLLLRLGRERAAPEGPCILKHQLQGKGKELRAWFLGNCDHTGSSWHAHIFISDMNSAILAFCTIRCWLLLSVTKHFHFLSNFWGWSDRVSAKRCLHMPWSLSSELVAHLHWRYPWLSLGLRCWCPPLTALPLTCRWFFLGPTVSVLVGLQLLGGSWGRAAHYSSRMYAYRKSMPKLNKHLDDKWVKHCQTLHRQRLKQVRISPCFSVNLRIQPSILATLDDVHVRSDQCTHAT